jgi:7 transmembrane receptor (rhodopsin family)
VEMSTASDLETVNGLTGNERSAGGSVIRFRRSATTKKRKAETKRERKAAKTLAIITGAFVVCWLPFFVMALLLPICSSCHFSDTMMSFFLWLGYFNSTLNPILYTIFSPEFRSAFQKLLRLKTNAKKRLNLNDPERRSIAVSNYSG